MMMPFADSDRFGFPPSASFADRAEAEKLLHEVKRVAP